MNRIQFASRLMGLFAAGLIFVTAQAAEPLAKPAKPGSAKDNAGIIVLDGKSPPGVDAGSKVATGIGLGGCAACDQPALDAKTKASATNAPKAKVPAKVSDKPAAAK